MVRGVATKELAQAPRLGLEAEAELVRLAKERSPEAWAQIYDSHYPQLFRYILGRVGERGTAEDLAATVFLEALKSIKSYTYRGRPLLAWLYRIARNVVNSHYRSFFRAKAGREAADIPTRVLWYFLRTRRQEGRPQEERLLVMETSRQGDPAAMVERWDLGEAIGKLTSDQRDVIVLRHFVGLTTPEIAAVLGKDEEAVYSLQRRALSALRRHLS